MEDLNRAGLSLIGSGVMAEAIISRVLSGGLMSPDRIIATNPRRKRGEELEARYGIRTTTSNRDAAQASEIVVLSTKPQVLPAVLAELRGSLKPGQLVASIVAGATIQAIEEGLRHAAVVRIMPNTPSQIGQGMLVWTATPEVSEEQRARVEQIFAVLGKSLYVEDEGFLDMATAISGTGPSYVFLVMESLIDAGVHLGFPRRIAQELVIQTMLGSVLFAQDSLKHPAELRNMVTSPGGTSAEALYQLEKGSIRTVFSKAVYAAYQRSRALGKGGKKGD